MKRLVIVCAAGMLGCGASAPPTKAPSDAAVERGPKATEAALPKTPPHASRRTQYTLAQMFEAIDQGDEARVVSMLRDGFEVNQSSDGLTPLHRALYNGELRIASHLLKSGAAVDVDDGIDGLPLYIALFQLRNNPEYEAIAVELINRGSPLAMTDKEENTSLMLSAKAGSRKLVQLFLDAGMPVNSVNRSGQSALDIAESANQHAIGELLKEHGAKRGAQLVAER